VLKTAGDDIFHGLDTVILDIDTDGTVPREVSAWLPTTGVAPAAVTNDGLPTAGNDGGHFARGANVSCHPLQNIMSVRGAS